MTGVGKKGITASTDRAVRRWLDGCSKAALADVVIDLVRLVHGEDPDGEALLKAIQEHVTPRLFVRGDRVPKTYATKGE